MKTFLIILPLIAIVACYTPRTEQKIDTKDLKYSAFGWYISPESDSFSFYMDRYIHIDKQGHYQLMRHDSFNSTPVYFEGILPDSLLFRIYTTFEKDTFSIEYNWNRNDGVLYDGFTYVFDKETSDTSRTQIFFIPRKAPLPIVDLAIRLDSFMFNTWKHPSESKDFEKSYERMLQLESIRRHGELPKMNKNQIEFKPPKIE